MGGAEEKRSNEVLMKMDDRNKINTCGSCFEQKYCIPVSLTTGASFPA